MQVSQFNCQSPQVDVKTEEKQEPTTALGAPGAKYQVPKMTVRYDLQLSGCEAGVDWQ
jgi:hypothetical protein